MDCREARNHWNLYHDSEGDAESFARVNAHLEECPACREWFAEQSRLERLIENRLAAEAADGPMWERVREQAGLPRAPAPKRRWWPVRVGTAVALGLVVAFAVWTLRPEGTVDLAEVTSDYHARLAEGREPVDFASDSDLDVEAWLRERVSFPVRCPPREDSGFLVQGAGVRKVDGLELAYLVGRVDRRPVSIFILPQRAADGFPGGRPERQRRHWRAADGDEVLMTVFDRNVVLVMGRAPLPQLERVLDAYGSYPHAGPADA